MSQIGTFSTEVRVLADSYDLGDQGLGAGLFVRQRRGGEIVDYRLLNFGGPIVK